MLQYAATVNEVFCLVATANICPVNPGANDLKSYGG